MTPRIAMLLGMISFAIGAPTIGTAWATILTLKTFKTEPERMAGKICIVNGGNMLIPLGWTPHEFQGWRCYRRDGAKDPEWIGPDILARRALPYENTAAQWILWEDSE